MNIFHDVQIEETFQEGFFPFHSDEDQMCVSIIPFTNKISKRLGKR